MENLNVPNWVPSEIEQLLRLETVVTVLEVLAIFLIGFLLLRILTFTLGKILSRRLRPQLVMIIRKVIVYTGLLVLLMFALARIGLSLTAILGAAGIAGVAFGFAAQTSVSNVISGVFLISEQAFAIGDVIKAAETTGIVLSVDLLSVKVRTFDNRFVRIPNESLIKSEVVNITRFPIRRLDLSFTFVHGTSLDIVKAVLLEAARVNTSCLDNPEPFYMIRDFDPLGIQVSFGVWFAKEDVIVVRNSLMEDLQRRFDNKGLELASYRIPEGGNPQ
jgi:small-conductance mechanosensitive channel